MYIERRYKKLQWFDLLDQIKEELQEKPAKERYIELLDELRMRKLESVSEGGTYKLKDPAKNLVSNLKERMQEDDNFADKNTLDECQRILDDIL